MVHNVIKLRDVLTVVKRYEDIIKAQKKKIISMLAIQGRKLKNVKIPFTQRCLQRHS